MIRPVSHTLSHANSAAGFSRCGRQNRRGRRSALRQPRSAFTLVEMLIAVGLVLLMMLLFAQIFSTATGSMSKMKGVGENDQRARLLETLFKGDLEKRSYRRVTAITPLDDTTNTPRYAENLPEDATAQQGYFYYSENDPNDDTDDVLQFTILVNITTKNTDTTPVYGRASLLNTDLFNNFDQPDGDDGDINPNATGSSTAAEVSYFLRSGILYRRVMLIRIPYEGDRVKVQPSNSDAMQTAMITGDYSGFWRDFDYSAYYDGAASVVKFHGATPLFNSLDNTGSVIFSLGVPHYRFGHNVSTASPTNAGMPREYTKDFQDAAGNVVNSPAFIGRFTHEETSTTAFAYPGMFSNPTNPMVRDLTLGNNGVVTLYTGGSRRGEDILLANVHAFDVKIFDDYNEDINNNGVLNSGEDLNGNNVLDVVNDFRDVGYSTGTAGYYHSSRKQTGSNYGGVGAPFKNIFDTWHPKIDFNGDGNVDNADKPPFRPLDKGPDGQPGFAGIDDDNNSTVDDNSELGWPLSDDRHPIKAIQIKLRYIDPLTNIMKELTMVHSLVD